MVRHLAGRALEPSCRCAYALLMPRPQMEEFEATLEQFSSSMEREFVFTPLSERERSVFKLFI